MFLTGCQFATRYSFRRLAQCSHCRIHCLEIYIRGGGLHVVEKTNSLCSASLYQMTTTTCFSLFSPSSSFCSFCSSSSSSSSSGLAAQHLWNSWTLKPQLLREAQTAARHHQRTPFFTVLSLFVFYNDDHTCPGLPWFSFERAGSVQDLPAWKYP